MTISTSDSHNSSSINPHNGFCSKTLIFHSLRPPPSLPPPSSPLSVTDFIFSLLQTTTASLIDATTTTTRRTIPYSDVPSIVRNFAVSLRQAPLSLSPGDSAFIISLNGSHIPILCLSLFSVGVVVSPANPASSVLEISNMIRLCKPAVAFATAEVVEKMIEAGFKKRIVVIESDEFESMMRVVESNGDGDGTNVRVSQSDTAAILYSSGVVNRFVRWVRAS